MTRRLKDPIPPEVVAAQRNAAHPGTSVWVEANAGSGKTHVLTQRVLRLLLTGVRPEEVLCLTYTKAAAAEMRKRVSQRLSAWALMPEKELRLSLDELVGGPATPAALTRARTLFAHALDTPGGLKILTIHAFCESVLHRFPVEAGVPFDFVVLEDFERQSMILRAREMVIATGLRGGANAEAVETLFGHLSDFSIREAIEDALSKARPLRKLLLDPAGAKRNLRALVGFHGGRSSADIRHAIEHESTLACRDVVELLGGDGQKTKGARFADYLARANLDRPSCEDLLAAFHTDDGDGPPRKSLITAKERALYPELGARLDAEASRIAALHEEMRTAKLIERSESLLDILAAIVADYEGGKRALSLLDFDDLIERAAALFRNDAQGTWVRYKLDAGITHILVDESQDTNEEQWVVVKLLAAEFFTGLSAVERPRTVFAVGDGKQSIFSFQGARPELFALSGQEFRAKAEAVNLKFATLPLATSFRTLPDILKAVDTVFADPERQAAVLSPEPVEHRTARHDPGGTVTLWPPVQAATPAPEGDDGNSPPPANDNGPGWPTEPQDSMASAPRQAAMRIASEIGRWVRERRPLGPRGRAVQPEDVLILVQTRSALFHELIRALVGEGLPTPGADRLMVTTHIAILDLMALGDVLLNTVDDLQLAALLRSPLFDVGEDEFAAVAMNRQGRTLWQALKDTTGAVKAASDQLRAWRRTLDFQRPYEFFAGVLYAHGGLRKFHQRFGSEVDDLFAEFLDLALEHEQRENPSLQGFLSAMRSREVMITRELSGATRGVRVMTIHGAKGLEAPIVILADAASKPMGRQLVKPVIIDPVDKLFVHASGRKDHLPATLYLREREEASQKAEYWRKLYVGMTRAEDELYVTGTLTRTGKLDGTWYEAIQQALEPGAEKMADGTLVFPRERPRPAALRDGSAATEVTTQLVLEPLPPYRRTETVRPSSAFTPTDDDRALETSAESVAGPGGARERGIAIHALLQHLTRIAPPDRPAVARKALLTLLPDAPASHEGLVEKAIGILERPEFTDVFGPQSRAEVPFLAAASRRGTPVRLVGRIDRLVVTPDRVLIVDFKSDATAPADPAGVSATYVTQLGLYARVAKELFPGRAIEAAILWTTPETLMILPRDALLAAAESFTMA